MLGLIDTLQDQSIGILTRQGIVPIGVGVLRWRIQDGDSQGNKLGVIFGAFVIVYLPNRLLGVHFLGINMGDLKYLFFGLALVVLMIFRPQGVFPARQQLLAYGKAARDLLRRPEDTKAAA